MLANHFSKVSFFFVVVIYGFCMSLPASAEEIPKLDLIGGHFDGEKYKCYREPCFTLKKQADPSAAAGDVPFVFEQWRHWIDIDGDCLHARAQLLKEKSLVPVAFFDDDECGDIKTGEWKDHYTGEILTDVENIGIDHRVGLIEAHSYGGAFWSKKKKYAFANDPINLIPTDLYGKEARDGQGTSQWLPPNKEYWCDYVLHRELVARRYEFRFPEREEEKHKEIKQLYCKY